MLGGSSKHGRGGKRNLQAPKITRGGTPSSRLSLGGRGGGSSSVATSSVEESFSLVRERPLSVGMAIKLPPDLVDEIKRVELGGGTAHIKFDINANNPNGNIIQVGNREFKFTRSREVAHLCDIYEERRSGDDGNGLLIESGGIWHKLNVERELDESTKNHVKRMSEEAERMQKSRRAIVLEHQNASSESQRKALAAAESNHKKIFKQRRDREPPMKKPKYELAGGPPKNAYKSGLSTTLSKSKISSGSPLSFHWEHGAPASPVGSGNLVVKEHSSVPDLAISQNTNKPISSDKEVDSRLSNSSIRNKVKHGPNMEAKPANLRSLLISLLMKHRSNGMSLKALEKAIGDSMPNSARSMEPILKQIATFQAPGRYYLKPGVETERLNRPPSQSGRSPETNHQSPASQKLDQLPAQDPTTFPVRAAGDDEEQIELNSTPMQASEEKINILNDSPEHFSEKKAPEITEGFRDSSSDGGSDSDSDSDSSASGSGSESRSRSKSRSPVGSGSDSDSESDASSSSKQASDEDVDIMTSSDEKEAKHEMQHSEPVSRSSPFKRDHLDNEYVDIGNYENEVDHVSNVVEIEKDLFDDDHEAQTTHSDYLFPNGESEQPAHVIKPSSDSYYSHQEPFSGPDTMVDDGFKGQPSAHERLVKGKSKRQYDYVHSDEKTYHEKRSRSKNLSQPLSGTINSLFGESPESSPDMDGLQGSDEGAMRNETHSDRLIDLNLQAGPNQAIPFRSITGAGGRTEDPSGEKRSGKHDSFESADRYLSRNSQALDNRHSQKGYGSERQSRDNVVSEEKPMTHAVENISDKRAKKRSNSRKADIVGKVKEVGAISISHTPFPPKDSNGTTDRSSIMNGRDSLLQRQQSELELGEFREPVSTETFGPKKRLEKGLVDSDIPSSDIVRGKLSNKIAADSGKLSPTKSEAAISGVLDRPSSRKAREPHVDDTRPRKRSVQSLQQHHPSRETHAELGSKQNRSLETSGGDLSRKESINSIEQPQDRVQGFGHHTVKESKKHKTKMISKANDRTKDASLTGSEDGGQKRRDSSSDENSSYSKYEKEAPELKGPVKDFTQYEEYVREYQEKYESYCSLNKILESYRDEFSKMGKELEACRGSDAKRYNDILAQMRSSFRRCGERQKRQKKIFTVLHKELTHLKQMMKDFAASYNKN